MEFATLVIALIVFAVACQGIGFYLEARQAKSSSWSQRSQSSSSLASTLRDLIGKASRTGFNKAILRNKKFSDRLELLLVRSGHVFGWKPEDLLFYKELGAFLGLLLIWQSGQTPMLAWIGAAAAGFMLPDFFVKGKGSARLAD